jgi:hypothetical protein
MITFIISIITSIYFANAEIVEVNGTEVIFVTDDGNEWSIESDGYAVGDKVTVKFHTNYTDNVEDDIVKKIYK